ncbi:MAG TPA: hypothetical protein VKG91_11505 [Roseiarcus sp.]|nr:hypothetical protein [Roseiarcus sp.]
MPKIGIAALGDLLQLSTEEVNKDRLYRALDRLLAHKSLSERCGELFAVHNVVLLYDVTSTYVEGQAEANPEARRGYSRDHRPDCAQVCIALVVTFDGFPLGYEVFAGNTHDSQTLQTIVGHDGGATLRAGARLDRRPRHGQRRESGVAAPDRQALLHRRAEVGAEKVRLRTRPSRQMAPGARRRRRSSSSAIPRPTRR